MTPAIAGAATMSAGFQGYEDQPAPRRRNRIANHGASAPAIVAATASGPGTDGFDRRDGDQDRGEHRGDPCVERAPPKACAARKKECGTDKPARRLREEHSDSQIGRQRISHLCREGAGREREQTRKELRCDPCDQERPRMLSLPGGAVHAPSRYRISPCVAENRSTPRRSLGPASTVRARVPAEVLPRPPRTVSSPAEGALTNARGRR